jgi:hypothetical protein
MDRKQFLKISALGINGLFIARFTEWFKPKNENPSGLKEAMFYRQADHLAG